MTNACTSDLRDQLRSIDDLTALPDVVARVLSVVQDESCTALDLASEIDLDPVLASKVLRLVNSSCYGLQPGVTSIPDAAILLGFDEVERITLAVAFVSVFGKDQPGVKALRTLWRHCVATSIAAGVLEQRLRSSIPELQGAHLAGLLHDIGKAVIALHFPEEQLRIDQLIASGARPRDAEREALGGATHASIGACLAADWGLPNEVVDCIARHHALDEVGRDQVMVHATHVANWIVKGLGFACGHNSEAEGLNPNSARLMDFDESVTEQVSFHLGRSRCLMGAVATGAMFCPSEEG